MKGLTTMLTGMALVLTLTATAQATPTLLLDDGVGDMLMITDGSSLDTSNTTHALDGYVLYNGTVGNFVINVTTGVSDHNGFLIDVSSLDYNVLPGSLKIGFSDTNFSAANTGYAFSIGGVTNGTVSYSAYYDLANKLWGKGTQVGSGSTTKGNIDYSSQTSTPLDGTLYSLTEFIDISHSGSYQYTSFNAALTPVPEPATMVLLGSGFLLLAIYCKRRKNA